jgi:hypothetical protein
VAHLASSWRMWPPANPKLTFVDWAGLNVAAQAGLLILDKGGGQTLTTFLRWTGMHSRVSTCEQALDMAWETLAAFDVVGVTECFVPFLHALETRSGMRIDSPEDRWTRMADKRGKGALHTVPFTIRPPKGTGTYNHSHEPDMQVKDAGVIARLQNFTRCDSLLWHEARRRLQQSLSTDLTAARMPMNRSSSWMGCHDALHVGSVKLCLGLPMFFTGRSRALPAQEMTCAAQL